MNLQTIEMDRSVALEKFREYRDSVRERHNDEDAQIMRGYRELARGSQLIELAPTIRAGGLNAQGLPRLAVMRADAEWCYFDANNPTHGEPEQRSVLFTMDSWSRASYTKRRIRIPGPWPKELDGSWNVRGLRAMVPPIPPALRPARGLANYRVLWEVERWEKAPRPPGDPALLRHVGGDLHAVVAIWDLTDLERAVLSGRRS